MNKKISFLILTMLLFTAYSVANETMPVKPHKPTIQERRQFDKMLNERLKLTTEQKNYIKQNRPKHIKEMERTISRMEKLRKKIKDIYILGIPKYQADLRTAPYKAELAILKQNAQKQKIQNRKNFENILTPEQKQEFEKIKKEHAQKRLPMPKD